MKKKSVIAPVFCLLLLLTAIGAYWRGRRDVWIEEFKIYSGNLIGVTSFETNMLPELKEFMKGRYCRMPIGSQRVRLEHPPGSKVILCLHPSGHQSVLAAQPEPKQKPAILFTNRPK